MRTRIDLDIIYYLTLAGNTGSSDNGDHLNGNAGMKVILHWLQM